MTADEIRAIEFPTTRALMGNRHRFEVQREIAAQLAEQNALMREDIDFRKTLADQQLADAKKRDALLATAGEGMEAWRRQIESAPFALPPKVTIPGEVTHLGCIVQEPEGFLRIATHDGRLVTLEPEEGKQLLALMSQPNPEVKPS